MLVRVVFHNSPLVVSTKEVMRTRAAHRAMRFGEGEEPSLEGKSLCSREGSIKIAPKSPQEKTSHGSRAYAQNRFL